MRRFRLLPLLALALLAACEGSLPEPEPEPDPGTLTVLPGGSEIMVGEQSYVRVHARDGKGVSAAGVTVRLAVVSGGAVLAADSAITGADGYGRVEMTILAVPGPVVLRASADGFAEGTAAFGVVAGPPITFHPASMRLVMGCNQLVEANFPPSAPPYSVSYSISDPAVARLDKVDGSGFSFNRRSVAPLQPGTAQVIASHAARADTMPLQVVALADAVPARLDFLQDDVYLPAAGSGAVGAWLFEQGGCMLDADPSYVSLAPDVISVDADGQVTSSGVGSAVIVATQGALADSIRVTALTVRAFPADTTIRVGERFKYRFEISDSPGVWRESGNFFVHSWTEHVSRSATETGWVQGVSPGTGGLSVIFDPNWSIAAPVTVTVVP